MTTQDIRKLFWAKKVILFDLDGTLYLGKKVLPRARELVWRLRTENKSFFYLTNNSSRSDRDYVKKLSGMGFPVKKDQIVMSTHLLISELKKKKWQKIFLLGTPAMRQMLQRAGIRHVSKRPQAVVVGFDKTLTYAKLEKACRFISTGVPYVVTHPDLYCPTDIGPEPDCGAMAKLIELVTKKNPVDVFGKPHRLMLSEVTKRKAMRKREMILVGDRLSTDIQMAKTFRIDSILVLSGETLSRDVKGLRLKSCNILPSVADLL